MPDLRNSWLPVVLLAGLLSACGGQSEQRAAAVAYEAPAQAETAPSDNAKAAEAGGVLHSAVLGQQAAGRQLVVSAALDFQAEDVRQTAATLEKLTLQHGGFVQYTDISANLFDGRDYPQSDGTLLRVQRYMYVGEMTVRVPRAQAADFVRSAEAQIRFLQSQRFRADDVSLDIRRQELEAARQQALSQRLDEVVSASKPGSKRDSGRLVQDQFDARAAEEYARLQQAYWQDQVDFATIRLSFRQPEAVLSQSLPDSEALARRYSPGFWASAGNMLEQGWVGLQNVTLLAIAFWPLWLLLAALWGAWRWCRRRCRRRRKETRDAA